MSRGTDWKWMRDESELTELLQQGADIEAEVVTSLAKTLNDRYIDVGVQNGVIVHIEGNYELSNEKIELISRLPAFEQLKFFDLTNTREGVNDETLELLSNSATLSRLETLYTRSWEITGKGIAAIANSPHLLNLRDLRFRVGYDNEENVCAIVAQGTALGRLEELFLEDYGMSDDSYKKLAETKILTNIRKLNLKGGQEHVTVEGFKALLGSEVLTSNLTPLALENTMIGNEGVALLLESDLFGRLEELSLEVGIITDTGAELLLRDDRIKGMKTLTLSENYISEALIEKLKDRFGDRVQSTWQSEDEGDYYIHGWE